LVTGRAAITFDGRGGLHLIDVDPSATVVAETASVEPADADPEVVERVGDVGGA